MRFSKPIFLLILLAGVAGCVTTGPGASRGEIESMRRTLEAKRLRHLFEEESRLNRIGYQILSTLPNEERQREIPFVGLLVRDSGKEIARAFSLKKEKGVVVTGLLTREAAIQSGLEPGDLITSVAGKPVSREKDFKALVTQSTPGTSLKFKAQRRGVEFESRLPVQTVWREISFKLNDRKKEVNAYATFFGIQFTLPMMTFLATDDELAVIVGHEIAHILKGHVSKGVGTSTVSGVLGGLASIPVNMLLPGAGSVVSYFVTSATEAQFSQEFEKEADYFGLQLVHRAGFDLRAGTRVWERFAVELPKRMSLGFLNTHPSTPERFVRTEKAIQELEAPAVTPSSNPLPETH